jgi:hypothetical protein
MSDVSGNSGKKFLTLENLSPVVKQVQFTVLGKIFIRAKELEKELEKACYSLTMD